MPAPVFCSTQIFQDKLIIVNKSDIIPNTYEPIFANLFKRNIQEVNWLEVIKHPYPYFIKPKSNNKVFDGYIITGLADLTHLVDMYKFELEQLDQMTFYIANQINFSSEYRLFIGNGKLYGYAHQKGPEHDLITGSASKFIQELVRISNNNFFPIDIGYIPDQETWAIVEINCPWALDDYGLDINTYMTYCLDAQAMIAQLI